jgi:hypothetical protein
MHFGPPLTHEEYSSLARVATGILLAAPIPTDHAIKLLGLRYIEVVGKRYEATPAGNFRIASGN